MLWEMSRFFGGTRAECTSVARLANVVVVCVKETFACALCLNSEEIREELDGSRFAGAGPPSSR